VISELELNGYAIERVYEHGRLVGLRLIEPADADTAATGRRHWWVPAASIGGRDRLPTASRRAPRSRRGRSHEAKPSETRRAAVMIADTCRWPSERPCAVHIAQCGSERSSVASGEFAGVGP
jgi:hypothetical protein